MKSFLRPAVVAALALAAGASPSLAGTTLSPYLTQSSALKGYSPVRPYSSTIGQSLNRPCIPREVYVPGPGGTLGYYKDSCTGAFIRPAVN